MRLKLNCTEDDWHALALSIDKAREGAVTVKVDKAALDRLMKDHAALLREREGPK